MKTLHCSVPPGPFELSGHGGLERPWRPFPGVTFALVSVRIFTECAPLLALSHSVAYIFNTIFIFETAVI